MPAAAEIFKSRTLSDQKFLPVNFPGSELTPVGGVRFLFFYLGLYFYFLGRGFPSASLLALRDRRPLRAVPRQEAGLLLLQAPHRVPRRVVSAPPALPPPAAEQDPERTDDTGHPPAARSTTTTTPRLPRS